MPEELRARLIRFVYSPDGRQADLALIEANGDEHTVRCLMKQSTTDIGGPTESLDYLNDRYGEETVCRAAQGIVPGIDR